MEQPDIIDGLRRYLAERLAGVPVYGFLPRDPPGRFVLIDRVGGTRGLAVDAPRITVEAWAPTKSSAYALCLEARAAISIRCRPYRAAFVSYGDRGRWPQP